MVWHREKAYVSVFVLRLSYLFIALWYRAMVGMVEVGTG